MIRERFDNYNGFGQKQGRTHGTISCYHHEIALGVRPCDECREVARVTRARQRAKVVRVPITDRGGSVVAWAVIDAGDVDVVVTTRWHLVHGYAYRGRNDPMHRVILGLGPGDPEVDHRNGDKLDNRRRNLRLTDRSGNTCNSPKRSGTSSRFRGVSAHGSRWQARVTLRGVVHYLGVYASEEDAAAAAEDARRTLHSGVDAPSRVNRDTLPIVWTRDARAARRARRDRVS